jgi:hypothetical protein
VVVRAVVLAEASLEVDAVVTVAGEVHEVDLEVPEAAREEDLADVEALATLPHVELVEVAEAGSRQGDEEVIRGFFGDLVCLYSIP